MCSLSLRPYIHCLIFCAFDTLVRSGFFFSTVLCHDQFAARYMTAPSASEDLKDFVCNPGLLRFLSHIQNGHLYSYPALAAERDCVPALASLIPGYCLEEKSHQISPSRHRLAAAILGRILLILSLFIYFFHNNSVSNCVRSESGYRNLAICVYRLARMHVFVCICVCVCR